MNFMITAENENSPFYFTTTRSVADAVCEHLAAQFKCKANVRTSDFGPGLTLDFGDRICANFKMIEVLLGESDQAAEPRKFRFWPHQLDLTISELNRALKDGEGKDFVLLYGYRFPLAIERRDAIDALNKIKANFNEYKEIDREYWSTLSMGRQSLAQAGGWVSIDPVNGEEMFKEVDKKEVM